MRNDVAAALGRVEKKVNRCRRKAGCGYPPCGDHAVDKPTFQLGRRLDVLVVGEAPSAGGWWKTGKAFYERGRDGDLRLSPTGRNLNDCLEVLDVRIDDVCVVEAIKCRPKKEREWFLSARARRNCLEFLKAQILAIRPTLILALGATATRSCVEIARHQMPAAVAVEVGRPIHWPSPWGYCVVLPLHHPSPANNARWPRNKGILRPFRRRRLGAGGDRAARQRRR